MDESDIMEYDIENLKEHIVTKGNKTVTVKYHIHDTMNDGKVLTVVGKQKLQEDLQNNDC